MTCVQDDFLRAIDDKKSVLLIMLDLSAAFDTVDHNILINRLKNRLGVQGNALQWFKSYLSDRRQTVLLNGSKSNEKMLDCGVPQGSVLGPILFTIYTLPLGDIIRNHGIPFHLYADDSQKYAIFDLHDYDQTVTRMESLVSDIRTWYRSNMLKCNNPKTEMMVLSSKFKPILNTLPVRLVNVTFCLPKKFKIWV